MLRGGRREKMVLQEKVWGVRMRRRRTSPFARTVATPIYLIPIHGSISAPMASDSTSSIFCRLRGSSPLFKGLYAS